MEALISPPTLSLFPQDAIFGPGQNQNIQCSRDTGFGARLMKATTPDWLAEFIAIATSSA